MGTMDLYLGILALMCIVFIVAIFKVSGQRKRQTELLERIAIALEKRTGP